MPIEMFDYVVQELRQLNYSGRVELYIYNEPMRDDRLLDLIGLVRRNVPRACIMINTNGDYISSHRDIEKLFAAGLNQLGINVYSSESRYIKLQEFLSSCEDVTSASIYQNIGPKRMAADIVPKFNITKCNHELPGVSHISNRAGNIGSFVPPLSSPKQKVCTRPFRFFNIDWRGNAMLCCNDYANDAYIGSILDATVEQLWNSDIMNVYRLKLQNGDRRIPVCCVCDFAGGYYPHMLHHVTFGNAFDSYLLQTDLSECEELLCDY